ncbi:hypothetical protein Sjap_022813 [Stephania japonica]|uniref:PRKR-interacting protein 1 n=1 Tax=Stephania japonica TaxID=461633 RepID=A0AAP0EQ37_9MAGN
MSSGQSRAVMEGDLQVVAVPPARPKSAAAGLPPLPVAAAAAASSGAIVEYKKSEPMIEDEDLEVKLRRIIENVPVRVSNTSGSSAGSGSGDFHQYRQMRRKEQDRLARMEVDYQKRKELAEFSVRREERMKAAEERTAKKRAKRQKKKQRKKEKKTPLNSSGGDKKFSSSEDDDSSDNGEAVK